MKTFEQVYLKFLNNIIMEGGAAFKNVERIQKKNIIKTINNFKKKVLENFLGYDISDDDLFLLGSTNKKKSSGDIDLGINANIFQGSILHSLLKLNEFCGKIGYNSYINTFSYKMLHVCFPQANVHKNVQIDLLFTLFPKFSQFYMYSPYENESKFKSAHRNALLNGILETNSFMPIKIGKDNEITKWIQLIIKPDGVYKVFKTLEDEEGNRLLYKNGKIVEPLFKEYANVIQEIPITHDVDEAIEMIFGKKYTEEEINTFEKVFDIVNNKDFKFYNKLDTILENTLYIIKQNPNLEIPNELKKYLK